VGIKENKQTNRKVWYSGLFAFYSKMLYQATYLTHITEKIPERKRLWSLFKGKRFRNEKTA